MGSLLRGFTIAQVLQSITYSMSKKFFIKIVTDPDVDLRKCVVGIACTAQAITDGYDVDVFFASGRSENDSCRLHQGNQ